MTDKHADKIAKLRILQQTFGAQLPDRLAAIRRAWATSRLHPENDTARQEFYRLIHGLAGSAGTFGYYELGERAKQLEEFLLRITHPSGWDDASKKSVDGTLARLDAVVEKGVDRMQQEPSAATLRQELSTDQEHKRIYVLEDDALLATEIASQLKLFGYDVRTHADSSAIRKSQQARPADVFLLDIELREGTLEGPRVAPLLQQLGAQPVPAVFISAHDRWSSRLAVVRAGGSAYFTKPLDFIALVERLDQLVGRTPHDPFRVVIVDDSALLADHYAAVLQGAGMETVSVNHPAQLLEVISTFVPDLVIMDLHMPQCSGVEAAQVIRQIPSYGGLPIVFLSTESALQQQLNALKLGGDDFLKKPIEDVHLVAAVSIRVERFRGLKKLMTCDSLTGLLNHINLKLALERELALAKRRDAALTFAMVDIDHFKSVNDRFGHPMGDRVIKTTARLITQRLRKTDIAGRYGGEEFAVILPDTKPAIARAVLDDLRKKFSELVFNHESGEFRLSFSAGITKAPPHTTLADLIHSADQALYKAKHAGRNRVVLDDDN